MYIHPVHSTCLILENIQVSTIQYVPSMFFHFIIPAVPCLFRWRTSTRKTTFGKPSLKTAAALQAVECDRLHDEISRAVEEFLLLGSETGERRRFSSKPGGLPRRIQFFNGCLTFTNVTIQHVD